MRPLLLPLLFLATWASAQPQPPSFCFVVSEPGDAGQPFSRAYTVVQQYRERIAYHGYAGSFLKNAEVLPLQGAPLFRDTAEGWQVFHPLEGMAESHLLVIAGADTMRIDLPEDMRALIDRAWSRWDRDSPEVIRFRPGRFAIAEVIADLMAEGIADRFAERLIAEDEIRYKEGLAELEAYHRDLPEPEPAPVPYVPSLSATGVEWDAYWAEQPPLEQVRIEKVRSDTVTLVVSGRIMLTGGCSSDMPIFGLDMLSDSGWVERIPMNLTQMDCGMPYADWQDHRITFSLGWWVINVSSERNELLPGTYRFLFTGGNLRTVRTDTFIIGP